MDDPLRDRRSVAELAENGQVVEISGVIEDFARLSDVIEADLATLDPADVPENWRERPVIGRLVFGTVPGNGRAVTMSGEVDATLVSVCQRCLRAFEWRLATTLRLLLVEAGEDAGGVDGFEVWELDGGDARPVEIVDETLVMAMPLSVRHDEADDCVGLRAADLQGAAPRATGERMTTPFAGLAEQMGKETKD